ncbi:MAG: glycosyltransferase family 39 protein, partial [Anaerolineae bacterium]|nr:glycosyltransferase family 39 protein [Anaerolineae bacterium]
YDPAWYGVDALDILKGNLPVYLPTNIGREAMFSYIVALCVAATGVGPHAIHLASALIGLLTVPATYLVADALFASEDGHLRDYGGLLSALMLAVSFWHQHWSRYGVRAILVPLFTTLSLWALARTLAAQAPIRRRRLAVLTGLLLGLSLYTYQSARVLPVLVTAAYVMATALSGTWTRRTWTDLGIIVVVCALLFAPMGLYLIRHPDLGNERIDQTWAVDPELTLKENVQRVWAEVVDAVKVIAIEGDDEPIHNLQGRPAMNAFLVVLALLGLAISLARVGRWPFWLLLAWIPAMSIAAFLTLGGQPTKRALGALPAIAMLVAVGGLAPLDWLRRRITARRHAVTRLVSAAWAVALTAGFGYSAFATYRDYFIVWGEDPALWTHFEGGRVAIGRYAGTLPHDEAIYSSPEMPDHPSIIYNSGGRTDLKGYNGRLCTVAPAVTQTQTTYIIVQHEEQQSLVRLGALYPEGDTLPAGPDYFGQPYFTAYRIPAGVEAHMSIQHRAPANWDDLIQFLGYDAGADSLKPGETLALTLYSQSLASVQQDYVLFVHLLGPDNPATGNTLWAQDDSAPCRGFYPTSVWSPPEVVIDAYTLRVPEDAPPGPYELQIGLYTWPDFQHLSTSSAPDGTEQITFTIGSVTVDSP